MRLLICSTGLAGHFNPLLPFIDAARERGDELFVVVPPGLASEVDALGVAHYLSDPPDPTKSKELWRRAARLPHASAARLLDGEFFGRLSTEAMLDTVESACDTFHPDLILREPCAYAGAVVAKRRGIAHAQVAISTARTEWSVIGLVGSILEDIEDGMEQFLRETRYLSRLPTSLDPSPFPRTLRYREDEVPEVAEPGRWARGSGPLIYLTFGSVAGGLGTARLAFQFTIEAVAGLDARVLVTTGRSFDRRLLGELPSNVFVESWVPQETVFPFASVVLCHGGSGTTYGALAAGLPIVFVPMFADQRTNARLITVAGAGVIVDVGAKSEPGFREIAAGDVPRIRAAVLDVLANSSYALAAQVIAEEIASTGSARDCLETLLAR
ncbi:MAG: glycosyltransferase [Acidimicrobiales bacterium]|jgi:UDP:flavonoid glycosyltransferase YjiC (YdhE family)